MYPLVYFLAVVMIVLPVAAILSKNVTNLNTFTIGFDDKAFDESPHV